ncbi:MAG: hypothetical protein H7256_07135 [Bdellovibrio sp.]|nr:hypothetical protein [Bdellovibrio sp.]
MKTSALLIGFLISMSVAHANTVSAAINLEGRVVKATGLETGRDGQSCSLTLQESGRKEAKFYFGIGDKSDLFGVREANTKRAFSDYVYMGPQANIGNHMVRQEEVIVDVKSNGQKAVLIRRMLEMDPSNVFTFKQLSEIKCELKAKAMDLEEDLSVDSSGSDSSDETSL